MTDIGIVILKGITKYENIKYMVRPEIKAPGIAVILLNDIEVKIATLLYNKIQYAVIILAKITLI